MSPVKVLWHSELHITVRWDKVSMKDGRRLAEDFRKPRGKCHFLRPARRRVT
jgi:hypothetical protein